MRQTILSWAYSYRREKLCIFLFYPQVCKLPYVIGDSFWPLWNAGPGKSSHYLKKKLFGACKCRFGTVKEGFSGGVVPRGVNFLLLYEVTSSLVIRTLLPVPVRPRTKICLLYRTRNYKKN